MLKLNRAIKKSAVGQYKNTAHDLWQHIPDELYRRLTSAELAMVLDALQACAYKSKALHETAICADGVVWDEGRQKLREVA